MRSVIRAGRFGAASESCDRAAAADSSIDVTAIRRALPVSRDRKPVRPWIVPVVETVGQGALRARSPLHAGQTFVFLFFFFCFFFVTGRHGGDAGGGEQMNKPQHHNFR